MVTRHPFGGGIDDWIFAEDVNNVPVLQGGAVVTFWNARVGGSQYTDITQDKDGATPIAELATSFGGDGYRVGQIPVCYGPPDVTTMWVSADGGERVAVDSIDIGDLAGQAQQDLAGHVGQLNAHGTGLGDLTDVQVGAATARSVGDVVGWNGSAYVMLTPAQGSGAVLLNPPPDGGGAYVGNIAQPPPAGQGEPWLQMRQPYSAADSNPDGVALYSTHSNGTTPVKTAWNNGNNEGRWAPSTAGRVGGRFYESYESLGGPSTGRFWELSTNPATPANREPLFGAYGTAHPTQPGWMVATRVLGGLLGVRAGGTYNSLGAVTFRGVRAAAGAPTSGTWAANDAVVDSTGALWLCTVGGTPGTWTTGTPPQAPVSKTVLLTSPAVGAYPVWRATRAATVSAVRAYRVGGTGAGVNAHAAAVQALSVDLSVSVAGTWLSGSPAGAVALAVGDTLTIDVVSLAGSPSMLVVQVDLVVS